MKKNKIFDMCMIALMAAIICVCSWITVPVGPIPFTMQTFAIFLAFRFSGGKKGTAAVVIYLLLGAVGLPVFSGFGSGIGKILGPTGGYMLGFIVSGIAITVFEKIGRKSILMTVLSDLTGMVCYYALGTIWFYFSIGINKGMSILAVMSACVFPFVIPDVIKIALAEAVGFKLPKMMHTEINKK